MLNTTINCSACTLSGSLALRWLGELRHSGWVCEDNINPPIPPETITVDLESDHANLVMVPAHSVKLLLYSLTQFVEQSRELSLRETFQCSCVIRRRLRETITSDCVTLPVNL